MADLTFDPRGRVDPTSLRNALAARFTASPLNGYVPPDGAKFGIVTGSPDEWARFGVANAKQESGFNPRSTNLSDPGGSYGLYQFNQHQFGLHGNAYDPAASTEAFARSAEHYVPQGGIGSMGAIFGSIRRPWETTQHLASLPPAQPGYGPDGLNEVGPDGPRNLSLLNIKAAEPSQSMMALGGPKPEGAPVVDANDDPRLQNRGGLNPLVMMGLGLLGSGMEGKGYAAGLLGGANAAQGFDSNRIQELNSERGWAIKQRELQRQQQADEWVKGFSGNGALAKILGPGIGEMIRGMPTDQAAQLVQGVIMQQHKQEAELALKNRTMQLAEQAYGGGQPQPSPQPQPAVGAVAAPQLGGQPPQPPQPQAGGIPDPRRIAILEAGGILPPGAAKVITEDPNYQIQQRTIAAQRMGLQPGTPAHQQYVLTGKFPDVQRSYPAIQKADEAVTQLDNSLDTAHTAKDLNPKAYSGEDWFPGVRTTVGGWFGNEHASDTQNYQAAAKLLSQEIAKANSGGRVNAFEQKLMADLQGGLGQTKAARGQILDRAIKHLETTRALKVRQAEELRNGTYYNPQGAAPAAPAAAPLEADGWKVERQ